MRIQAAQKHTDHTDPDPEHCIKRVEVKRQWKSLKDDIKKFLAI